MHVDCRLASIQLLGSRRAHGQESEEGKEGKEGNQEEKEVAVQRTSYYPDSI
jgi:hypothetical protein